MTITAVYRKHGHFYNGLFAVKSFHRETFNVDPDRMNILINKRYQGDCVEVILDRGLHKMNVFIQ